METKFFLIDNIEHKCSTNINETNKLAYLTLSALKQSGSIPYYELSFKVTQNCMCQNLKFHSKSLVDALTYLSKQHTCRVVGDTISYSHVGEIIKSKLFILFLDKMPLIGDPNLFFDN